MCTVQKCNKRTPINTLEGEEGVLWADQLGRAERRADLKKKPQNALVDLGTKPNKE